MWRPTERPGGASKVDHLAARGPSDGRASQQLLVRQPRQRRQLRQSCAGESEGVRRVHRGAGCEGPQGRDDLDDQRPAGRVLEEALGRRMQIVLRAGSGRGPDAGSNWGWAWLEDQRVRGSYFGSYVCSSASSCSSSCSCSCGCSGSITAMATTSASTAINKSIPGSGGALRRLASQRGPPCMTSASHRREH